VTLKKNKKNKKNKKKNKIKTKKRPGAVWGAPLVEGVGILLDGWCWRAAAHGGYFRRFIGVTLTFIVVSQACFRIM
jgi:hypothetical protein